MSESCGPTGGGVAPGRQREMLLLWALVFLAFRMLFPLASAIPPAVALPVGVAVFMLLSLLGPRFAAPLRLPAGLGLALFVVFGALSLGIAGIQPAQPSWPSSAFTAAASDLFLILAAAALGHCLLRFFREPNLLVPAVVVAAVMDYAMVYSPSGTTRALLERHSEVVSKLSVQVPVPGAPGLGLGIGFGDFVFLSLFLSAAVRFGLRERRTFWMCTAFLVVSMGIVAYRDLPVPALVPMGIAFLVANAGRIRFERSELVAMGAAAAIVVTVAALALGIRALAR